MGSPRAAAAGEFDPARVLPSDRVAYDSLFYHTLAAQKPELLGVAGAQDEAQWRMDGAAAVTFFRQSGLPDALLAKVWELADIDHDNTLDRAEFAVAMHLTRLARKGMPLPAVLPRSLVPEDKLLHYNAAATGMASWTTFQTPQQPQQQAQQQVAMTTAADGTLTVADPSTLGVSAAEAAAFDATRGPSSYVQRKDGSQMPQYALPGASFEQKLALESELNKAVARRTGTQQQQQGPFF